MESQPQNPESRNNPENFPPCICKVMCSYLLDLMASALAQAFIYINFVCASNGGFDKTTDGCTGLLRHPQNVLLEKKYYFF